MQYPGLRRVRQAKSTGILALARKQIMRRHAHRCASYDLWNRDEYFFPHAAGIPGELRIVYTANSECVIKDLEPDLSYRAYWFDPMSGQETAIGVIEGDDHGDWESPPLPVYKDWILVLQREEG